MILDSRRLGRIEGILRDMTKGSNEDANVRKDAAAFRNSLRRLDDGGAELYANRGVIKVLTSLIEGRMSSLGSRIDIPGSVKNFKSEPGIFTKHLMNMNPARLVKRGYSHSIALFFEDSFALGLVLLQLLEEKEFTPRRKAVKVAGPVSPGEGPAVVGRRRGRPPRNPAAAGPAGIPALRQEQRPSMSPFANNFLRMRAFNPRQSVLSGMNFCRII